MERFLWAQAKDAIAPKKGRKESKWNVWLVGHSVYMVLFECTTYKFVHILGAYWLHNNLTVKEIEGGLRGQVTRLASAAESSANITFSAHVTLPAVLDNTHFTDVFPLSVLADH
jgi:hypothetical protein